MKVSSCEYFSAIHGREAVMGMLEFDGRRYLDGRASDPRELGWMLGAPPPVGKRVTFESGSFMDFPQLRWSLSHMRELGATVNVWRGRGSPSPLNWNDKSAYIDALTFTDKGGRSRRFDEALFDTYVDGILVLHRGLIVYERYFGALEPHLPHACHSVTKSFAGTLAAAFVHEGVLDEKKMIPHYLPELRGTAWDDATLRQVMDMQTAWRTQKTMSTSSPVFGPIIMRAAGDRGRLAIKVPSRYLTFCAQCAKQGRTATTSPTRLSIPR